MATTIAEYYTDELIKWHNAVVFYNNEIHEFGQKLAEVIRRNSIVGIAQKVEAHQTLLNHSAAKFYKLQKAIQQQQAVLKTDSKLVDDTLINNEAEKRQAGLRRMMQAAEKEYIDVKFDCYNFLSGTLKKKKD
jgi:hypothetical protein